MMPKISVIIPVYNVEEYLQECIDSVLSQTFTDFECIIIDDGSIDNSGRICDEYAIKDERIKVIHKKNGGVSSARNAGLDIAQGEWIAFIDSDDWVDDKYLGFLYNNAIQNNVDVSICGVKYFENRRFWCKNKNTFNNILTSKEAILLMFDWRKETLGCGISGRLIRKQLIDINNIRYNKAIKNGEDGLFFWEVFKFANKIYYSPQPYYFYRQISSSASHQIGFTLTNKSKIASYDIIYEKEQDLEIRHKIFELKIIIIYAFCVSCVINNKNDDAFKENMFLLKKYIFNRILPWKIRIKIFLLEYLPFLVYLKNLLQRRKGIR